MYYSAKKLNDLKKSLKRHDENLPHKKVKSFLDSIMKEFKYKDEEEFKKILEAPLVVGNLERSEVIEDEVEKAPAN